MDEVMLHPALAGREPSPALQHPAGLEAEPVPGRAKTGLEAEGP